VQFFDTDNVSFGNKQNSLNVQQIGRSVSHTVYSILDLAYMHMKLIH